MKPTWHICGTNTFRIRALCNILESGILNSYQYEQALNELKKKCFIYANGCLKRGKKEEGEMILKVPITYVQRAL